MRFNINTDAPSANQIPWREPVFETNLSKQL
jgi:hypothetical protein